MRENKFGKYLKKSLKKSLRLFPYFRLIDDNYKLTQQISLENQVILQRIREIEINLLDKYIRENNELREDLLNKRIGQLEKTHIQDIKKLNDNINELIQITNILINTQTDKIGELLDNVDKKVNCIEEMVVNTAKIQENVQQSIYNIMQENWRIQDIQQNTKQLSAFNVELLPLVINNLLKKSPSKIKILIIGFYGAPNIGDELMLHVLISKLLENKRMDITIMLCDNPQYNCEKWDNVSILHLPKTRSDFIVLANSFDYVIWGGGAMLDDSLNKDKEAYKSHIPVILKELSNVLIRKNNKVVIIGVSSNTKIEDKEYISSLSDIIEGAYYCSVRDTFSKEVLVQLGIESKKVDIIYDIVFALEYKPSIQIESSKNVIGLVLIGDENRQRIKFIIEEAIHFIEEQNEANWEIQFIPFYTYVNCDIDYINSLVKEIDFKSVKYTIIDEIINIDTLVELFMKCTIMICMRYHASLLCLKYGIPVINLIYDVHRHYHNKLGYLASLYKKYDYFIPYSQVETISIKEKLREILENKTQLNQYLLEESKDIEKMAIMQLENIIEKLI